jgi:hypothetical protein
METPHQLAVCSAKITSTITNTIRRTIHMLVFIDSHWNNSFFLSYYTSIALFILCCKSKEALCHRVNTSKESLSVSLDGYTLSPLSHRPSAKLGRNKMVRTARQSLVDGKCQMNTSQYRPIPQPISTSLPAYAMFIFALLP